MLKTFKIQEHSLLLFPCCNNSHWFLVVGDMVSDKIYILDSLDTKAAKEGANDVKEVLEEDIKEKLDLEYVLKIEVIKTPQQNNGSDCGLFCIGFITNIVNKGATSFLGAVETGDISSWLELEGASRKRREITSYIEMKSKEQGLEDWRIKRDSKSKASGKENMKEVEDSKDVVEKVVELGEESKDKEKEVEVDPMVELGKESKERIKNENLQECLLGLKFCSVLKQRRMKKS